MEHYASTVKEKRVLANSVVELALELASNADFKFIAGQYVGFQMEYTARSYSMVSTPAEPLLRFCIKIVEDGIGSDYVSSLKVGDKVELSGPYGQFVFVTQQTDLLFIATGVGIAPVISIITDVLQRGFKKNITLLFGLRSETDIFYHDSFKKLTKQHHNFIFVPMLSQPKGEWPGEKGRVTNFITAHPEIVKNIPSFICGSQAMVTDVRDILIRQGVEPGNIKQEIFF